MQRSLDHDTRHYLWCRYIHDSRGYIRMNQDKIHDAILDLWGRVMQLEYRIQMLEHKAKEDNDGREHRRDTRHLS